MRKILSTILLISALALVGQAYAGEVMPAATTSAMELSTDTATAVAAAVIAEPETPAAETALSAGDTAWMIMATILVLLMAIPGLALFYGGLVRSKNMLSVLMQVFIIVALISVLWVAYGYSLTFSNGGSINGYIGGLSAAFLSGVTPASVSGTIPELVFVTFQLTFACLTPALIVGAFAERIKFSALLVFVVLWTTLVYFPIAHMVWGGGILADLGAKDFAGGTVVHINAGIAALVGAIVVGKRIGYGKEAMPPHSMVLTMVGASLLWAGWFGFNVGSQLAADGTAGLVMINTQVAAAAAVLGWILVEWLTHGKPSMLGGVSGAIAGLVSITPACAFVGPLGAIVLGFLSSMISFWAVTRLKNILGYDDTLDVFGIHGVAGIIGAIGTGVLMAPGLGGVGFDAGVTMGDQVYRQTAAVGVTVLWCGVVSYVLFKVVDACMGLRVSEEAERDGLDTSAHGERAYHY